MPVLLPVVKVLDDILGRVLEFEQQHPKIMKWVATFAEIATAVMLVVGPVMLLTGAIGYLFTSRSVLAGARILGGSFTGMLGPIGLVTAAGYLLYQAWTKNWDGIQQKTASVVNWIKGQLPQVTQTLHNLMQSLGIETDTTKSVNVGNKNGPMHMVGEQLTRSYHIPQWTKVAAGALIGRKVLGMVSGHTSGMVGHLRSIFGGTKSLREMYRYQRAIGGSRLGSLFEGIVKPGMLRGIEGTGRLLLGNAPVDLIKGVGRFGGKLGAPIARAIGRHGGNAIKGGWGALKRLHQSQAIQFYASQGVDAAKTFGKKTGSAAINGIVRLSGAMKTLSTSAVGVAKNFANVARSVGRATLSMAANVAKTVAIKTAQLAVSAATKIWTGVQLVFNAVMDANPIALIIIAVAALIGIIVLMVTHWKTVINVVKQVWSWMKNFASDIGGVFGHLWHDAVSWGTNIVTGIWNGIKGMWGWLKSNIAGWIKDVIPGPIRKALGINSPSRLMAQYGMYTAQGLAQGMMDHSYVVKHAARQLSIAATPDGMANETNGGITGIYHQVGSMHNTTNNVEIHIHDANEKQTKDIVDEVMRRLGPSTRTKNMSRAMGPNRLAFGRN